MKVNEQRPPVRAGNVPLPKPRPADAPALEAQKVWAPGQARPRESALEEPSMQPVDGEQINGAMLDALKQVAPMGLTGLDPLQLLDGVKDGQARIAIPLEAGRFKVSGHNLEVKPGTVAYITVDVKDGKVMPAVDQHGKKTGRGTQVTIEPPLDGPLWTTGNGAYVADAGKSEADLKIDIGGFFDSKLKHLQSTKLPDVVRTLSADDSGKGKKSIPDGLIRLGRMQFDARVSMKDNVVTAGAAKIDLAPGTQVSVSGTGKRATIDGQLNIDGATLKQPGADLRLGPGSAHLHADLSRNADGTLKLSTQVSNVNGTLERATLDHARRPGDPDPDRVELANATITNGRFTVDATLKTEPGATLPSVVSSSSSVTGQTTGALVGAKLTLKDAQGDAEVKLGPGRVTGSLTSGANGRAFDLAITGTTLDVKDLQTANQGSSMGIHHGHFEGDLKLTGSPESFDLRMAAKKVDVRIDGYKGRSTENTIDFERIDLSGTGTLGISTAKGMTIDGDLTSRIEVNDLAIGKKVDLAKGSVLDGTVSHFQAGGPNKFELQARANVDAQVEAFDASTPQAAVHGSGRLRGDTQFDIRGSDDVRLVFRNATADVNVERARIGSADGTMGLTAGRGSTATLNIAEARYGRAADEVTTAVTLKPGSVIDATLDEGHVMAGGKRIELDKGAHARFELSSLESKPGAVPALQGSLSVQTSVHSNEDLSGLVAGGMKISRAGKLDGKVNLEVPNVTLAPDGKITYRDAKVSLDARIGDVKPGAPRVGQLSAHPKGVLAAQDVQATTAAAIAGVAPRDHGYNAIDAARRVRNGVVDLEIPIDGTLGSGWPNSADFKKGTVMKLHLEVKEGQVIADKSRATFSQPGDGPLWVTAKGAYFDKDMTLRKELGGWVDPAFKDLDHLPRDLDGMITRLLAVPKEKNAGNLEALKFRAATVTVKDATFLPGRMEVPGGWVDLGENTKLSVNGGLTRGTVSGKVDLRNVDIADRNVALKGRRGTADLTISLDKGMATTKFENLCIDTEYGVNRRNNGDYVKLAKGRVTNGTLTMKVPVDLAQVLANRPQDVVDQKVLIEKLTEATLDIPAFSGIIEGARLSHLQKNGRRAVMEIGRAQVDGEVHITPDAIDVKGTIRNADVLATGLSPTHAVGAADVESLRLQGSGTVDFSTQRGLSMVGDVTAVDVKTTRAETAIAGQRATANRSRITGSGHVEWSSAGGLAMEGDLHVEAELSGEGKLSRTAPTAQPVARPPARQPVKKVTVQRSAALRAAMTLPAEPN